MELNLAAHLCTPPANGRVHAKLLSRTLHENWRSGGPYRVMFAGEPSLTRHKCEDGRGVNWLKWKGEIAPALSSVSGVVSAAALLSSERGLQRIEHIF